jgi:hypothetical protein
MFLLQKAVDSFPRVRYFNLDGARDPRFVADRAEVSVLICLRAVVLFPGQTVCCAVQNRRDESQILFPNTP